MLLIHVEGSCFPIAKPRNYTRPPNHSVGGPTTVVCAEGEDLLIIGTL